MTGGAHGGPSRSTFHKNPRPSREPAGRVKLFVPQVGRLLELCARYGVASDLASNLWVVD